MTRSIALAIRLLATTISALLIVQFLVAAAAPVGRCV